MPTSATGVTPVITGGVTLLVEFGSLVGELTLAVLVSEPLAGTVTTTVRLLTWPLARSLRLQFTTTLLFTPLPLALTKVTVAGKGSVTTPLRVTDGPKFVPEIFLVMWRPPGSTVAPSSPISRSATGVTPVITGGVTLLVEFGSLVGELTLAVLVSEPLAGAVTTTVRRSDGRRVGKERRHRSTPLLLKPLPLALTKVTGPGKRSVTTTLLAIDGPKFVTEIV